MNNTQDYFNWMPCPVVFIGTAHGDQRDIMTANAMFVSEKEPLFSVSVATGHLTDRLIQQSNALTLSIAADDQKKLAVQLGSARGDALDKFARYNVDTMDLDEDMGPVPCGVAAWMQCRVEGTFEIKGYRVIIGRVTAGRDLGRPPLIWRQNTFFGLQPT